MLNEQIALPGKVIAEYELKTNETHILIKVIEYEIEVYECQQIVNGEIKNRWVCPDVDDAHEFSLDLLKK